VKGFVNTPTHSNVLAAAVAGILLAALALAVAPTQAHGANRGLKIIAPTAVAAAPTVRYATEVSGGATRVAFFVDGRRHWAKRTSGRKFKRSGYLRTAGLGKGRHRLAVKVRRRSGRILSKAHVLYVSKRSTDKRQGSGKKGKPAPEPTPALETEPSPEREPEPLPEPEPSSEPAPAPTPTPAPADPPLLDAGFESGLLNWNVAGVGEVVPTVVGDIVRSGSRSGKVALSGSQSRSELILGGTGTGDTTDTVRFREGDEYYYAFSVNVRSMVYGRPGAHNLIMQFKSDGEGSPAFGLQLWDYEGDEGNGGGRGLWSHGGAMGGDRFLAPLAERVWHDVVIHFRASRTATGFYEIFLDGKLVDSRSGVSMIRPDRTYAYVKNGLYRNGGGIPGSSEIRLDAARLGRSLASVAID